MIEHYLLGRVHSIDEDEDTAWIELVNGSMSLHRVVDLPRPEVGAFVHIANSDGEVEAAPAGAAWPRQFRTIGVLVYFSADRAMLEIAGQVRVVDTESISMPETGGSYFFDERSQLWERLGEVEAKAIKQDGDVDTSAIEVEHLSPVSREDSSFGGMDETFLELVKLVTDNFAARGASATERRAKTASGAIFFGPPGTGKTHLARSVAQSVGADLISVNGPELIDKWLGSTEKALRMLFETAKKYPRSIIFIDEFDTVGSARGPDVHEATNRQVGQLLSLTDGAADDDRPFLFAATNRLEDVDPAFLRPGRFDYAVEFRLPDARQRLKILRTQTRHWENAFPLEWLASSTNGWTPAELAHIWTQAELARNADDRATLALEDVLSGYERARQQHVVVDRALTTVRSIGGISS